MRAKAPAGGFPPALAGGFTSAGLLGPPAPAAVLWEPPGSFEVHPLLLAAPPERPAVAAARSRRHRLGLPPHPGLLRPPQCRPPAPTPSLPAPWGRQRYPTEGFNHKT